MRWLPAGTSAARLQMAFLPGLASAGHFAITAPGVDLDAQADPTTLLRFGQHLQRFWLTAERLRLAMQPSLAPLCFGYYGSRNVAFPTGQAARRSAAALNTRLHEFAEAPGSLVFLGSIGRPAGRGIREQKRTR